MKTLLTTAALAAMIASSAPVNAGGLFGPGGLIRGSVGKIGDKIIDRPLTPILRETVKVGLAAVAGAGCAALGAAKAVPACAAAGAAAGDAINNAAN